jgi:hypothetical protein
MNPYVLGCMLFVFGCINASGQTVVHGFVADSATLSALPNVNVRVKDRPYGTTSDLQGHFSLQANDTDTLIFSIVGYHPKKTVVGRFRENAILYMKEKPTFLNEVMVVPDVEIQGIPRMRPESPYVNPTYTKAYTDTPGVPNMQTFAPSYIYKGIISRFSKYERERRKLPQVQAQNEKAKRYIAVLNDIGFREELKQLYDLTEEEFYHTLTIFNERYHESVYDLETKELIALLHMFYAEVHGK